MKTKGNLPLRVDISGAGTAVAKDRRNMKKLWAAVLFGSLVSVNAITIDAPSSLTGSYSLNGYYAYKWAFALSVPSGQTLSSASLSFNNVTLNVANSSGTGYLYTDLLNVSSTTDYTYTDYDNPGDYFDSTVASSSRVDLGTKFFSSVGTTLSWSYVFTPEQLTALTSFASDGKIAFGFDPDCHYSVGSITFQYYTTSQSTSVPDEGQTLAFLGIGLLSLFGIKRFIRPSLVN